MREVDRVLNSVREALARIEAAGAATCNPLDAALLDEIVLKLARLKAISVEIDAGVKACSTQRYTAASIATGANDAAELSPVETADIVSIDDNGPLAFRLRRRVASANSTLEAIVPIGGVFNRTEIEKIAPHRDAVVRLAFGGLLIDVLAPDPSGSGALASVPVVIGGAVADMAVSPGRELVRAQSQSYPLAVMTSVAETDPGFDSRRAVIDLSVSTVLAALIVIAFLRAPIEDFGPKRFAQAIRRDEFDLAYRPIVDLKTGKLAGAIIDMQWQRSRGIVLTSADFMPAVIRSGSEAQMLHFALRRCDRDLAEAYRLRPQLQLKVALDHETLIQPEFVDRLQRVLDGKGIRASQLVLALTRIGDARYPDRSREAMRQLQRLGVRLEIRQSSGDIDFGHGANDVAVAAIGVDSRVTLALETPSQTGAAEARFWIRNIVAASANTGARVCAYRVCAYEALKQLKDLGVDEVEGPVFATPLSSGSYMALVARAEFERAGSGSAPGEKPARRKATSF